MFAFQSEFRRDNVNGNRNGLETLARISNIPVERLKYIPDARASVVDSIERGILFLVAFWSGPALRAFSLLTEEVSRLKAEHLDFVVVDVDGSLNFTKFLNSKGKFTVPARLRGCQGKLLTTSGHGLHVDCFKSNTIALLEAP